MKLSPNTARVASVAPPLAERLKMARGGWMNKAITVSVLAAGLFSLVGLGFVGAGSAYVLDRWKSSRIANAQKSEIAKDMRIPVAAQLGIHPDSVNIHDLEKAAEVNPMIRSAFAKVDREKKSSDRAALAVAGAGAVIGALPGVQLVTNTLAHGAIHMGGAVAADAASRMLDKKILEAQDMIELISEKKSTGQPIEAADIFMLRMAQDEPLQEAIRKQNGGRAFHKMNDAEKIVVMQAMPDEMAAARGDAELLNNGADDAALIMHSPTKAKMLAASQPQPQGRWAHHVGGPKQRQGSYAGAVRAQQAALIGPREFN